MLPLIEKCGEEIQLVKEGRIIAQDLRSQDKFTHDIRVAVAKHCVENLKEEVKKGMRKRQSKVSIQPMPRLAIGTSRSRGRLQQRLASLRRRLDQMYEDKLDGRIDEDFWARKSNDCREQERALESDLMSLRVEVTPDSLLTVRRETDFFTG